MFDRNAFITILLSVWHNQSVSLWKRKKEAEEGEGSISGGSVLKAQYLSQGPAD